jgi:RNA polymerase sigma-70 factor (ECF subfamily)
LLDQQKGIYSLQAGGPCKANDETLVIAAKSGEQSAFAELCNRHSGRVQRAIYPIVRNASETEDILQETFLKAFVSLASFEGRSMFSTWVIRIAINSALMTLRRRRHDRESCNDHCFDSDRQETRELQDSTIDIEAHYAQVECVTKLREAVLRLKPTLREVLDLKLSHDLSNKEIADLLGISIASVKARLYRARLALRHSLMGPSRAHAFDFGNA